MMSPENERRRLIGIAIDEAAAVLTQPIDAIVVHDGYIEVRGWSERLRGRYHYSDSYDASGNPLLGGGHWSVEFGPVESVSSRWLDRLLALGKR